jgi:hypothetical protein
MKFATSGKVEPTAATKLANASCWPPSEPIAAGSFGYTARIGRTPRCFAQAMAPAICDALGMAVPPCHWTVSRRSL